MTSPVYHAESSARLFGGHPDDYIEIHEWFDESSMLFPDCRHRSFRHHATGIKMASDEFGSYIHVIKNGRDTKVPVHYVGTQHCIEDMGKVPTFQDWVSCIQVESWMQRGRRIDRRCDVVHPNREVY